MDQPLSPSPTYQVASLVRWFHPAMFPRFFFMHPSRVTVLLIICPFFVACQSATAPKVAVPAAASSPVVAAPITESWVRTEIRCAMAPFDAEGLGLAAAEGTWRTFLDEEVSPRFPEGFSVIDAYGQWREETGATIVRERSKVLVIVYGDTAARRAGIEALCTAYKKRTGEKSVLVVTTPVSAQVR